jgi:hypothetical protein
MRSSVVLLVMFALLVSLVLSALSKDDVREQMRLGGLMFAGFLVSAIVLGWLMFPLPF